MVTESRQAPSSANLEAFDRMCRADPVLVDIQPAGEVVPGMTPDTILASGPRLDWEDYLGGARKAIVYGALFEGLATDVDDAERKLAAGADPRRGVPGPRLHRIGGRHLHRLDAGVRGGEPGVRQPGVLQLLRGRVPPAAQLRRLRRGRARPAALPRRGDRADAPRGGRRGREASPSSPSWSAPCTWATSCTAGTRPPRCCSPRELYPHLLGVAETDRRACRADARVPGRERLLLPPPLDGEQQGDGRPGARHRRLERGDLDGALQPGRGHPRERPRRPLGARPLPAGAARRCSRASPPTTSTGSVASRSSTRPSASAASPRPPPSRCRTTRAARRRRWSR